MNICLITSEFPPDIGGISTYTYNLAKRLILRGHKVTVLTRGTFDITKKEEYEGITVYRVTFVPFYPDLFKIHKRYINKLFKELEDSFDLVNIHGCLVPIIDTRLPKIATFHGTAINGNNMPVRSLYFLFIRLLAKNIIDSEKAIIMNSDVLTAVSRSCSTDIQHYYKLPRHIFIAGNGVDTKFFIPKIKEPEVERNILFVGRLETGKGLMELVDAARVVCNYHHDVLFRIVGSGTIERYLRARVDALNLRDKFLFEGHVYNKQKLKEIYQESCIFVLPSHNEGLPTTILEAMACGLTTIASNVGGIPELIMDGKTGILIPPKDHITLASTIMHLLDNPDLRFKIGFEARNFVERNNDWDKLIEWFEELYIKTICEKQINIK